MKLQDAIYTLNKIHDTYLLGGPVIGLGRDHDAIRLGIEALEHVRRTRLQEGRARVPLLPGETNKMITQK